jgi:hypothetical protein
MGPGIHWNRRARTRSSVAARHRHHGTPHVNVSRRSRRLLQKESATYWLATVGANHRPHLVPVLAVWADGHLFVSAGATTRKARNLEHDPHCVISVEVERLDLVVEGSASRWSNDLDGAREHVLARIPEGSEEHQLST